MDARREHGIGDARAPTHRVERCVFIRKPSRLEELLQRYCSRGQVEFLLTQRGESFAAYEEEHAQWEAAVQRISAALPSEFARSRVPREYVTSTLFRPTDLIVTVGPDGLVANVAKYLDGQPILAVNPDRQRIDGVLARWTPDAAAARLAEVLQGNFDCDSLTLAEARTSEGHVAYAANEFLVGRRDMISSRYRLMIGNSRGPEAVERQSSSGVLVATGLGSTAWAKSVITTAFGIVAAMTGGHGGTSDHVLECYRIPFPWSARHLLYMVREAFPTRSTKADHVFGRIEERGALVMTSEMTDDGGAIFSDGVVEDAIPFPAGSFVTIRAADRQANLVTPM